MQPGWRRRKAGLGRPAAGTAVAAIAAVLLILGGAFAWAATSEARTTAQSSVTQASPSVQGSENPKSVNIAARDSDTSASTQSVAQTVGVSVLPGDLTVTPTTETIPLTPSASNSFTGALSTVTVDDARGSLVGWDATVTLQSLTDVPASVVAQARLCISPDDAVAMTGRPSEVRTGHEACGSAGDPLTLFFAPPNGGGGTFDDTGHVTVELPNALRAPSLTATLVVAVADLSP